MGRIAMSEGGDEGIESDVFGRPAVEGRRRPRHSRGAANQGGRMRLRPMSCHRSQCDAREPELLHGARWRAWMQLAEGGARSATVERSGTPFNILTASDNLRPSSDSQASVWARGTP